MNSIKIYYSVSVKDFPFVPPSSIFASLLNYTIVLVRCKISWQRSKKLSSLTNKAFVVNFQVFSAFALYSKYESLNFVAISIVVANFSHASKVSSPEIN